MENRTKLEIGAIIAMVLLATGAYFIAPEDTAYHCEAKDMVMICDKLSSGLGTRCYFEDTYKICKEGWKKIEIDQEISLVPAPSKGLKWLCSTESCVRIE